MAPGGAAGSSMRPGLAGLAERLKAKAEGKNG